MSPTIPNATTPAPAAPPSGSEPLPPLPDDVRAFCDRHGLTEHLPTTFRLIREEFHPAGEVGVRIMEDAESEHTDLVLNVPVAHPVSSVLDRFTKFLERWIPVTPAPVRERVAVIWTFRA